VLCLNNGIKLDTADAGTVADLLNFFGLLSGLAPYREVVALLEEDAGAQVLEGGLWEGHEGRGRRGLPVKC
jgi:hypothetical protein